MLPRTALLALFDPAQFFEDDLELRLVDLRSRDFDVVAAHDGDMWGFREKLLFIPYRLGLARVHFDCGLSSAFEQLIILLLLLHCFGHVFCV